jgi:hypothetical protein
MSMKSFEKKMREKIQATNSKRKQPSHQPDNEITVHYERNMSESGKITGEYRGRMEE